MSTATAIDTFVKRVNYLPDTNYGDFKRKLDLAMMRLWQSLGHDNKEIDQLLWNVKKQVMYTTALDIESARNLALDAAEKVRELAKH